MTHNVKRPVTSPAYRNQCQRPHLSVRNGRLRAGVAPREVDSRDGPHTGEDLLIQDGELAVRAAPGLGIDLDENAFRAHSAPGEDAFEL